MVAVRCVDGRRLEVVPVPVLDRTGAPYETTLRLLLDGAPFGEVGQRVGGALRELAARLAQDRPQGSAERGVRRWAGPDADAVWPRLGPYLGPDVELFCWRARDPDDVPSAGELRAVLEHDRRWQDGAWRGRERVVLQAWGDAGTGVRAALDLAGLRALVAGLLAAADGAGPGRAVRTGPAG